MRLGRLAALAQLAVRPGSESLDPAGYDSHQSSLIALRMRS